MNEASSSDQPSPSLRERWEALRREAPSLRDLEREYSAQELKALTALREASFGSLKERALREYEEGVAGYGPLLRAHGRRVGESLLREVTSAVLPPPKASAGTPDPPTESTSHAVFHLGDRGDAEAASGSTSAAESLRAAYQRLAPIADPVLSPFVEGLWGPFDEYGAQVKRATLYTGLGACAAAAAGGFVAGYLFGRARVRK
jgi:hypothetical protein